MVQTPAYKRGASLYEETKEINEGFPESARIYESEKMLVLHRSDARLAGVYKGSVSFAG